jgi:transcriptional regulator with XRE-family HTH domain
MIKLGRTIKKLRIDKALSQEQLADAADITPSYLSLIENSRRDASIAVLRRIAKAFGVPAEVIIWDAIELPSKLDAKDRRICELAKIIVRQFMDSKNGCAPRQKSR